MISAGGTRRPTALVTGPTSGIGHSFARQLAARGHDLVLVSRDRVRLESTAEQLSQRYGIDAEVLVADLTERTDMHRVAARAGDLGRPVDICVNNAGFGVRGRFVGGRVAEELDQLDVLTAAVLVVSHAAAGAMRARGHGAIVNVSSVAGFAPMGTYGAAKGWCTLFTEYLAAELHGTGVTATALCPGFVRTEFHARAGIDMASNPEWLWLDADDLVEDCLRDVRAGKVVSVPSVRYRLVAALTQVLPAGGLRSRLWGRPRVNRQGRQP